MTTVKAKDEGSMRSQTDQIYNGKALNTQAIPSVLIGLAIAAICSGFIKISDPAFSGSYLILLSFNAAFASSDFIDSLRGKRDILSPRSLLSAIMLNCVYIAPLLHLRLDIYPGYIALPENMELSFQNLSIIHFAGLLVYFLVLRLFLNNRSNQLHNYQDLSESGTYLRYVSGAMLFLAWLSFALYLYQVFSMGGPAAWLQAQLNYRESALGPGWLIALGEAFPSLFFMAYLFNLKNLNLEDSKTRKKIAIALVLLVVTVFITSGLRGSRANLIWPTLTGLILVHILFIRIHVKTLILVGILALSFSGLYDIYKKTGTEGFQQFQASGISSVEESAGREFGIIPMLTGDFSRSSMQAVVLDRRYNEGFSLLYGKTYIGNLLEFVPGENGLEIFPNKRIAATEILYGEGSSKTRDSLDSRIYGLQGEALMNFGVPGSILIMSLFAVVVKRNERKFAAAIALKSIRLATLSAILTPALLLFYLSDLDNVFYNLTSNALLPAVGLLVGHLLYSLKEGKNPSRHKRSN